MAEDATYCVGIDLGGSSLKIGLLSREHKPGASVRVPTPRELDGDGLLGLMRRGVRQLLEQEGLDGSALAAVGIGAPGPLAISRGVILVMPNIPGVENYPIRDRLSEALGAPAILENDANAATFGEHLCGSAKGQDNVVMLTLGTGLGSGILVDGKVLHGAHEIGAEMGHVIVQAGGRPCGCGQRGCLEQYTTSRFIAREAQRRMEAGQASALAKVLRERGEMTARDIQQAAKRGDALAAAVWDEAMYYLAVGCVTFCRVFDPDTILLAGGMSNAGDFLMAPLKRYVEQERWNLLPSRTEIKFAALGEDAGFIGAAGLAWQYVAQRQEPGSGSQ